MIGKLLPRPIDNTYLGYRTALWLFGLVVAVRTMQSLSVLFNGYNIARDADGIPVDTYAPGASQQMVALFAQGSLWRLTFCVLCAIMLARYRSAVPLMLALHGLNYLGAQVLYQFVPLTRTGTPPGPYVNFGLFILTIIALILSLRQRTVRV